jgi:hypothetical protein
VRRLVTVRRRTWLIPVLVIAFLTLGLPRFLVDHGPPDAARVATIFANLCRDHGGTVATGETEPLCTVRYGETVYRMDAVTPDGWDADAAHYERVGCETAQRQQDALGREKAKVAFVFHRDTGICERRQ